MRYTEPTPLDKLAMALYKYRLMPSDVALLPTRGYVISLVPCKLGWPCQSQVHWHTISIQGEGYPWKDHKTGRFISRYKLWDDLRGVLPQAEYRGNPFGQPICLDASQIDYPEVT